MAIEAAAVQPRLGSLVPEPFASLFAGRAKHALGDVFGLQAEDAAWVSRRVTPQPGGCYDEALHFDAERLAALNEHNHPLAD